MLIFVRKHTNKSWHNSYFIVFRKKYIAAIITKKLILTVLFSLFRWSEKGQNPLLKVLCFLISSMPQFSVNMLL